MPDLCGELFDYLLLPLCVDRASSYNVVLLFNRYVKALVVIIEVGLLWQ